MRSLPLIVIGALLAGLIAAGVFLIRQAEARAEEQQAAAERAAEHEAELRDSAAAQDVAVEQRLDAIEVALESMGRRMDELQARDARSQEITDASIEAAVRSWLEKNREKVSGGMPGPEKRPKAATVQDLLAELSDTSVPFDERQKTWRKASEAGVVDELLEVFEEKAKQNPNDPGAQLALGNAYIQALQYEPNGMQKGVLATKADQAFDRTLDLDERNWDARFLKGLSLSFWPTFLGKRGESIKQFEILIQQQETQARESKHAQSYLFLGNLYQESGKGDKARKMWERGLRYFPKNAELKGKLGRK